MPLISIMSPALPSAGFVWQHTTAGIHIQLDQQPLDGLFKDVNNKKNFLTLLKQSHSKACACKPYSLSSDIVHKSS